MAPNKGHSMSVVDLIRTALREWPEEISVMPRYKGRWGQGHYIVPEIYVLHEHIEDKIIGSPTEVPFREIHQAIASCLKNSSNYISTVRPNELHIDQIKHELYSLLSNANFSDGLGYTANHRAKFQEIMNEIELST